MKSKEALYKLSPSDFKYLWEDCKYCFYQKVKLGVAPYTGAFPAVFTRMNGLLQNSIMGLNLRDIHPDLPSGIVAVQEGFLRSVPVPGAEDCYIGGRFDILTKLEDGTYSVIDFKIMKPDAEQVRKYASQVHAYKFALEHPANGKESVQILRMGLISVSPDSIAHIDGKFVFTTTPQWHPIAEDMDSFYRLIADIADVLHGDLPPEGSACKLCAYRRNFR